MLHLEEDMATVFYGPDFAVTFTRQRAHAADLDVVAIFSVVDADALDGHAIAATRKLQMPAAQDVRAEDVLVAKEAIPDQRIAIGEKFLVLDNPKRVSDGAEMEALLGSVQE